MPSGIRVLDSEIRLIPWYPAEAVTINWYQDPELCRQTDNRAEPYSPERLRRMYAYLTSHGECRYIEYRGVLVGDITLKDNGEICIVIAKEYQNRHIGRRCIGCMIELAREKGLERVTANIYSFNAQSRAMFTACGFADIGSEWFEYRL